MPALDGLCTLSDARAAEVAELSFRILGKLDVAIEHVVDWFTTRDTKFA
jgi:hypothetical protein